MILAPLLIAMAFGCGSAEPTIRQQPTSDRPAVPQITAERLQACVKEYGHQLDGGSWAFSPKVQVDQDGYVVDAFDYGDSSCEPEARESTTLNGRRVAR